MKPASKNNWLTPLLRWLSGDATRRDEQALDALAQDDPFLAEAMEGYRSLPEASHAAAVTKLKADLRRKYGKRPRGVVFYLARVAAVGLVVLGAWAVFRQVGDTAKSSEGVAQAPQPEMRAQSEATGPATAETATTNQSVAGQSPSIKEAPKIVAQKEKTAGPTQSEQQNKLTAIEPEPEPIVAMDLAKPTTVSGGTVPTDTTLVLAKADDAVATKSPAKEAEALQPPSPPPPPSDVISTKLEARKKDHSAASQAPPPEPVGKGKEFEKYIEKNLKYPEAAAQQRVEGEVTLRFRVLPDGTLTDFEVVKPLGSGCDEEAERLLREGPKWKPAGIATYTVKFKL